MAGIDRFIKPIRKVGAASLIIASGEKVSLMVKGEACPLTPEAVTPEMVAGFLREILPPAMAAAAASGGKFDFPYSSPFGGVQVMVSQNGGGLRLVLEPAAESPQAASVKSAVPVTAPSRAPVRTGIPAIHALFQKMLKENCSDLHISTGNPPLFRKDGDIQPLGESAAMTAGQTRDMLLAITPDQYRTEFERTHDVDFSYEIVGVARFRCNLFLDRLGMGGVFRVIPTVIPTTEELGLSKHIIELCHHNKGLVVVTGPTGSGKSTTLAAMIDYINRNFNGHLISIEDPIEFVHQNMKCLINQREVGNHTQDFKTALRAALREDPDYVLVGEMRDLETVAIAIETAETGHLVFGTLHTNTAPSTVDRIIDQFSPDRQAQIRTMLSESLNGVISQVLCKKKGGGRVAAHEVLIVTPAIRNLIREGKTFQIHSIMQTGKGVGMACLNDSLYDLVRRGLVDPVEAYSKAVGKAEFKALLARDGVQLEGI